MSDRMRWKCCRMNPVESEVDSASVIEIGDLVYEDTDGAKPASSQADQGSETANQELLADNFLGVAMQRSRSGETDPVRVATTGVFGFDCPSGTFELGDLVGVDYELHGGHPDVGDGGETTHLLSQSVAPVSAARYAIGRVVRCVVIAATDVLIDIDDVWIDIDPR